MRKIQYYLTFGWFRAVIFGLFAVFLPLYWDFSLTEQCAIFLFFSLVLEQIRAGGHWLNVGFSFSRFASKEVIVGFGFALASMILIGCVEIALGGEIKVTSETPFLQNYQESIVFVISSSVFGILVKSIVEELIFRGILFQALMESVGGFVATFLMSALFALGHWANPDISALAFMNIALAGVLFGTMYIVTRSLWLPISFHFFWNFLQHFLLGSPISGFSWDGIPRLFSFYRPENSKIFDLVLGRNFGIEEGVLVTLILIVLIAVVNSKRITVVSPVLAARLFNRQAAESALKYSFRRKNTLKSA